MEHHQFRSENIVMTHNKQFQGSHAFSKTVLHAFSIPLQYQMKKNNFNTINYVHFTKKLFMEHNAKNNCKTVISGIEKNLNKQMTELGIANLLQYCIQFFLRKMLATWYGPVRTQFL